jgi:sulfite exporter TauE/SafE/copper chaperone CopZ/heme/copper-type cytochrome/quinol oxidase subunit 2
MLLIMNKTTVDIKGMHCRSCEILIEDELQKIPQVTKVEIDHKTGRAEIYYQSNKLDQNSVEQAVKTAGYNLGKDEKPWFSKNPQDYLELFTCLVVIFFLYYLASDAGIFNIRLASSNNFASLPVVLLIGLTAGLSTCMALVGGLVLGASARFAEKHPQATPLQKFKPHLIFNVGRIASFFLLGGVIGYGGSFFQLSPFTLGILTIIVGLVMFFLGIQLIDMFPKLKSFSFALPKSISRALGIHNRNNLEYSHKNAAISGALTFFLPCGFTQAMQLYAISTGNVWQGAATMGVFAIGTAPGLLGVGGLTSFIKGAFSKTFFKFAGVVVVLLALFNLSNGYNLTGLNGNILAFGKTAAALSSDPNVVLQNGVQVVKMTQNSNGYTPNSFTIQKNVPVRWIINSVDPNSCAASIASAKLGIKQTLQAGENIIEFTPAEAGPIKFTCIMGMYGGVFNVIDSNSTAVQTTTLQNNSPTNTAQAGGSCGSSGGGCGCGSGTKQKNTNNQTTPTAATLEGNTQVIKTTYTQNTDIQPSLFAVTVGQPVRLEIDAADDGAGCMKTITIPDLTDKVEVLKKDGKITFNFTPQKTGEFNITCAMGMTRGSIVVNSANDSTKTSQASPSVSPTVVATTNASQLIKAIYASGTDIQPNQFTVKAGAPVRMEINVKDDGYGCMGSITIPGLTNKVEVLQKGKVIVFDFIPNKTGKYDITCAMGVPRGAITVN